MHNHQIKSKKKQMVWDANLKLKVMYGKKILQLFDWLPKSVSDHKILMCMCLVPTPRVGT